MIAIVNDSQLREVFRHLRDYLGYSRNDLALRVHVDRRTITGRESGQQGYTVQALADTARVFGYRLALLPETDDTVPWDYPVARATGTGWPE
jgi:transcriptional regulator with XRE-family HTH domain